MHEYSGVSSGWWDDGSAAPGLPTDNKHHTQNWSHISPQAQLRMWLIKHGSASAVWLLTGQCARTGETGEGTPWGLLPLSTQNTTCRGVEVMPSPWRSSGGAQ